MAMSLKIKETMVLVKDTLLAGCIHILQQRAAFFKTQNAAFVLCQRRRVPVW